MKLIGQSMFNWIINPLTVVQRFFTTLASAGSQHFTIPTLTLTGDFEIEADIIRATTTIDAIFGESGATNNFVAFTTSTNLAVKAAGLTLNVTWDITDGKLHKLKITRVSGLVTVFGDGASLGSMTIVGNSITDFIGANNTPTNFWSGIIANVKITDAGTLIRDYPINENWVGPSTVLEDKSGNNQDGTAVNITTTDAEKFTLFTNISPNEWRNADASVILQVAGT